MKTTLSKIIFGLFVVALCLIAGCKVGPEYKRPEMELMDAWRTGPKEPNSIADIYWWEFFKDETLLSLIKTAVDNNKDLLIAVARIEEARGIYRAEYGEHFPRLDAGMGAGREQKSKEISPDAKATDNYTAGLTIAWELDLWGKLEHATDAAKAELLATEEARRAVILSLVSDIAQTYFELLDLDRQIQITEDTITSRKESLHIANIRFEGGITSKLEVKQADSELASAMAKMPELRNRQHRTENVLCILLGQNPGPMPRGGQILGQYLPKTVPAGLPAQLLHRRPDIRQAEQKLMASVSRVGVAEAEFYPTISLSGLIGVEGPHFSTLFNKNATVWEALAEMAAPIFTAGRLEGKLQAEKARYQQARLQYEDAVQKAFKEVDDSLNAYIEAIELRKAQEYLVESNTEYAELALEMYEEGEVGYLEYLDAKRKLFTAELELSDTIRTQLAVMALLYKALGGGWNLTPEVKAELKPAAMKTQDNN